jgi:predicted dehydrogenase
MGQIRAKAIQDSGKGEVVCVYDVNQPTDTPYEVVTTDMEVIRRDDVDAVFVCTPNYRIEPLVIEALKAGKHVFSEKPPAFNAEGVRRIREAEAAAKGCKLMYGFNHRHHGSIQKMKEIVDSGEMGKVLWMRGRYGKEVDESFFEGWRAKKDLAGGGIMLDQGIHMLDLFLHLGGGFDEVHAVVSNLFWKIDGIEDNVFAILKSSESGVCASLHSTMTQWRYLFSLEVFLEKGSLILNGLKTSSGAYGDEDLAIKRNAEKGLGTYRSEERMVFDVDTSWESEVEQFFESIREDKAVGLGNSADALQLMEVMDQVYAKQG